ncbi:nuclear transport factor 2 family protein [Undibacterium sp. Jales W-56]|uniref:nuclear transport factor 2 family protein n=1 Tax=Undibacterium sp. Jales W-56 TaxID=2897325 RepID=UPI0021CE22AC|nr:nuclear transport factor 2 family protein [Undibacterium sp. Jales W-56]MCU6435020.1 nuclear transport factor 2 family protein [Undibacterium sp. Jales W-56]
MNNDVISYEEALRKLVTFFETLTPESVQQIPAMYAEKAYFKDPFNEVQDVAAVQTIFVHMFAQVEQPRFKVHTRLLQGNEAFISWDFLFTMKRFSKELQRIKGATHLRFLEDGRVSYHRDYWDAAEELYEKLPVLGSLMRMLKRAARN